MAQASPWKRTASISRSGPRRSSTAQPIAAEGVHVLMDRVGPRQLSEAAGVPEAVEDHAAVQWGRHACSGSVPRSRPAR